MLATRLGKLGPAACCALAIFVTPAAGATRTAADPRPQAVWKAYPLSPRHPGNLSVARAVPAASTPRRVASTARAGSTTVPRSTAAPDHSSIPKIVAAVVVGIVIGLIPALVLAAIVGVVPRPRRLRRRSARLATAPRSPHAQPPPALELPDDESEDREHELYYAGQRYRIEDLRRTISARLATSSASKGQEASAPTTEHDNR